METDDTTPHLCEETSTNNNDSPSAVYITLEGREHVESLLHAERPNDKDWSQTDEVDCDSHVL